jgi:hypothetical protein
MEATTWSMRRGENFSGHCGSENRKKVKKAIPITGGQGP